VIIKLADFFCGIGGIRLGFERACQNLGVKCSTVYSCDINKHARKVYKHRFGEEPDGDITKVNPKSLPDFDVALAGFPCQAFAHCGQKKGFEDARGTLFFNLAKIIAKKKPTAIFLENVKGLTFHDKGRTFRRILDILTNDLGYNTFHNILNSKNFGVPQNRPRIYIVAFKGVGGGFKFPEGTNSSRRLKDVLETSPVHPSHYLSSQYWETLKRHKARHAAIKGHQFGYVIRDEDDIAGAVMCSGMGRERNLVIDPRTTDFSGMKKLINTEHVRTMTMLEWERLQGFDDGWTETFSTRRTLLGNSVTVPVIEAIATNMVREILNPNPNYRDNPNKTDDKDNYADQPWGQETHDSR